MNSLHIFLEIILSVKDMSKNRSRNSSVTQEDIIIVTVSVEHEHRVVLNIRKRQHFTTTLEVRGMR